MLITRKKRKRVVLPDILDVADKPFPELGSITEETRADLLKYFDRIRGAVRLRAGRILTDEQREERRRLAEDFLKK